jgi:3-hydroxymyristoyl/3-hydroxydecanoyl-(acyl carrier protein) dehydratase
VITTLNSPETAALRFDKEQIAATLPQRFPFLFLESATIENNAASGTYAISEDEPVLKGHFKDVMVLPASIMIEALGQLASLYILKSGKPEFESAKAEGRAWFSSADSIRCQRICHPGDVLTMQVQLLRAHPPLATFSGSIHVDGQRTASVGEMTLAFGPIQKSPTALPAAVNHR